MSSWILVSQLLTSMTLICAVDNTTPVVIS